MTGQARSGADYGGPGNGRRHPGGTGWSDGADGWGLAQGRGVPEIQPENKEAASQTRRASSRCEYREAQGTTETDHSLRTTPENARTDKVLKHLLGRRNNVLRGSVLNPELLESQARLAAGLSFAAPSRADWRRAPIAPVLLKLPEREAI